MSNTKRAICLFSSAGIGEQGIKAAGIDIAVSNELLKDRHQLYEANYPQTICIQGDIWEQKESILSAYRSVSKESPFLVYATPPCQGMSTNGLGRLLHEVKLGTRDKIDHRNRLIIPAIEIIKDLKPSWVLLENVPNMRNTVIFEDGDQPKNIVDFIFEELGDEYVGKSEVVTCSDYGIPQRRKRLITILTRDPSGINYFNENGGKFFPISDKLNKMTLRDAIGDFPPLDSKFGLNEDLDFHPLHRVPIMKSEKYWWVSNTPEGKTAFDNQCVNPKCGYQFNGKHKDITNSERAHNEYISPLYCEKCAELLPRPCTEGEDGKPRLIRGFHSAYRRMKWDEPATTLTQNYHFEASDNKVHPSQNRVLSMYEASVIQTVADYNYNFKKNGTLIPQTLFAQVIGESVPPKLIEIICELFCNVSDQELDSRNGQRQLKLEIS